jgi:hypothetical protein
MNLRPLVTMFVASAALAVSVPARADDAPPASVQSADGEAPSLAPTRSPPPPGNAFLKLGLGLGVPYGGLGLGLEAGGRYASLLAGVGTLVVAGPGWAVGGRVYFAGPESRLRVHLTAAYGTTAAVIGAVDGKDTFLGPAGYLGLDHDVGSPGAWVLTYGVGYVPVPTLPENTAEQSGSPIKILFGAAYRFSS